MKRRSVLASLTCIGLIVVSSLSVWTAQAIASSRPISQTQRAVLGASTSQDLERTLSPYPVVRQSAPKPVIQSRYFALYHAESGKLIAERDANTPVPIASTTKLMTARVAAKNADLTDVVTVSKRAASITGSLMGIQSNEKITVLSLLNGLLLVSGNDAANALAEHVGRKLLNDPLATNEAAVQRFVDEMNKEAVRVGMEKTQYFDPAGLDDSGHSTAFDLAKLTATLFTQDPLQTIASTPQTTVTNVSGSIKHELKNSNRLVNDFAYPGAWVGKTGFTPAAGHCLVATATRGGVTYIAVILSTYSSEKEASALEARKLLDWAFTSIDIVQPGTTSLGL